MCVYLLQKIVVSSLMFVVLQDPVNSDSPQKQATGNANPSPTPAMNYGMANR